MPASQPVRLLLGAVLAAAALVGGLVAFSQLSGRDDEPAAADAQGARSALFAGIPQDGLVLGDADAPVTLVEYADVQCPFCADWARDALPALVDEYVRPGLVRLEFRGLAFIGPESELGLRSVLAAAEQDRAWDVLHLLFEHQGGENAGWLTEASVREWAASVPGLDVGALEDARSSSAVDGAIVAASEEARIAGVPGTPAFQAGPTGEPLQLLRIASLDADGLRPHLDRLLGR